MTSSLDTLPKIGAPATRALHDAGYTALRQLAGVPRADLAKLHGMGPKALVTLQAALEEHGLGLG
ncbi:helix-hairpin-helix protein [Micromonospora violae]|uniref:Helix-hairpin-helix protein n=1 Tax=Micromonospora violae TaxID=1278207 RepID=A0A4Q7UCA2_9ACTN|nr:helix-hairpin-helix domain-containing protein [Micromonospora violae]RZT78294.1 helix-hairpin-helix protein [Micromonospora violae]